MTDAYDAILIVAFGGPEKREDVIPFLENVTRGRNVPRERLREVAQHYDHFDGVSPLNAQVRELIGALRSKLDRQDIALPIFWGNRNWHPWLADSVRKMTDDGVNRALAFVLAPYSSYSSCRQYLENIEEARQSVGFEAPQIDKIRVFYNHPKFIAANVDRMRQALQQIRDERRQSAHIAFSAHSLPISMATSCDYESQLTETCRLVANELQIQSERWKLVYQSRSGQPTDPWLKPDIVDHLREVKASGIDNVVIAPIGFLSDHLEVLFDLDVEAKQFCDQVGLNMVRAATVGTHPLFVQMIVELVQERLSDTTERRTIGRFGSSHDTCPVDCCPVRFEPA